MISLLGLGWLASVVLATGMLTAFYQGEFPAIARGDYRIDLGFSLLLSLVFGPIALVAGFFLTGFAQHGFQWLPLKEKK